MILDLFFLIEKKAIVVEAGSFDFFRVGVVHDDQENLIYSSKKSGIIPNPELLSSQRRKFMIPEDIYDSKEMQDYADHVCDTVYLQMKKSSLSLHLHSDNIDSKLCIELGLAVLCNKPIVAVIKPGMNISNKLKKVVDKFITYENDVEFSKIGKELENFIESDNSSEKEEQYFLTPDSLGKVHFSLFALQVGTAILHDKVFVIGLEKDILVTKKLSEVVDKFIEHEGDFLERKKQLDAFLEPFNGYKRMYLFSEVSRK